jgi:hypothetical protein
MLAFHEAKPGDDEFGAMDAMLGGWCFVGYEEHADIWHQVSLSNYVSCDITVTVGPIISNATPDSLANVSRGDVPLFQGRWADDPLCQARRHHRIPAQRAAGFESLVSESACPKVFVRADAHVQRLSACPNHQRTQWQHPFIRTIETPL